MTKIIYICIKDIKIVFKWYFSKNYDWLLKISEYVNQTNIYLKRYLNNVATQAMHKKWKFKT